MADNLNKYPKYPIGEQDFKSLREMNFIYVDKTQYIWKIIEGSKYYFLARPRRFGKSLFLSTLQYFFEGKRELFKGLYIYNADWKWEAYPVFRLDLNREKYAEPGKLSSILDNILREWENRYEIQAEAADFSSRFGNILATAHKKTGKQAVILVDEYDKPLVGNLNEREIFEHYRIQLASLYSNFKSNAEHIRLVFMTGVSRFSKLSVFSDLNNLKDITFTNDYADICGITEKEFFKTFQAGIEKLAINEGTTYQEACRMLKENYDGYRFAEKGSEIYNPWSVLNAMDESVIKNFWSATGKPTLVAEVLKRSGVKLKEAFDIYCTQEDISGLDLSDISPTSLLYQTGYLTIKGYNPKLREYHLGIPNQEVKGAIFRELLPYYYKSGQPSAKDTITKIIRNFYQGRPEEAMENIRIYFSGVDYTLKMENENNFHNAMYLLFDLIGLDTKAEVHTSEGRIDLTVETDNFVYIIELKYDYSAQSAIEQIKAKRYYRKFLDSGKRIILIGASFSSKTRTLEDWIISKC